MMKIIKNIVSQGKNTLGWGWESRKSTFWTPKMPKFRRKNDENHENHEKTENRLFLAIYGGVPPRMTKILSQTRKMMSRDTKMMKNIKNPVPDRVGDPCGGGGTPPWPGGGAPPRGGGSYINASPTRTGVFFRPLPLRGN